MYIAVRLPFEIPLLLALLLLGPFTADSAAQSGPAGTRVHHGVIQGDLAEALGAVAVQSQIPILAELALPLPHDFHIAEGEDSAEHLLNLLVAASPNYSWEWDGRVAHFYNRHLVTAPADFLNLRFESFVLTGSVARLSAVLRNAIWACHFGIRPAGQRTCSIAEGGVIGGIWPSDLQRLRLAPRELRKTSARKVLLDAENESGQFFTMVVFPRENAITAQDAEFAFSHWAWHSLSDTSKPYALPFSWYGRVFRVQPDTLLEQLITRVSISRREPGALVSITVNEVGRVEQVRVIKGDMNEAALRKVRSWRFEPYRLDGLPAKVVCDLPLETGKDGSPHPSTATSGTRDH